MSRGYRLFCIAAIGFLILCDQGQAKHYSRGYSHQTTAKPAVFSDKKELKPRDLYDACNQKSDRQDLSICASLREANASEQANAISADGLRWNRIGIFAVIFTLIATACAALAAGRAATAATKANSHSKEVAEHQLRPYIFIKSVEFEIEKVKNPPFTHEPFGKKSKKTTGRISYDYKNTGDTPAKNVRVASRAAILARGAHFDYTDFGEFHDIGPLGPGDRVADDIDMGSAGSVAGSKQMIEDMGFHAHICGRIEYTDEWQKPRWTTFHFYVDETTGWDEVLHTHPEGNDYA